MDTIESGGAAEEAGSGGGCCVCRRADIPEHLQQTLLQVKIDSATHAPHLKEEII